MKKLHTLASISLLVVLAILCFGTSAASAAGEKVLVFGNHDLNDDWIAATLSALGYDVTHQRSLPADISGYDAVFWISAYGTFTPDEVTRLVDYIEAGGGVYFTGERPLCEAMNDSVQAVVNAVVAGGGITIGEQGIIESEGLVYTFVPTAKDGITTTPNVLTTIGDRWAGGIAGLGALPDSNILITGKDDFPIGAVWDESDMASRAGRVAIIMDVNWVGVDVNSPAITENIAYFLVNAGVLPPEPAASESVSFVGTYDVELVGSPDVDVVSVGNALTWSFTISNENPELTTFGLSFRADVPDALAVDDVLITAGTGAVRPLEDGTIWVDLEGLLAGEAAVVQIETTVVHASEVCITGAVVDVVYDACVDVYPGELPQTGELPLLWQMIR